MLFGVRGMCSINTSTYWLHLNYQSSNSNIPYLGLTVTRVMPAPSEMASVSPYEGRKKYVMRGGRISAYAKEIYNCLNDSRINPEKRGCSEKQGGRKRSNSVLFRDWSGSLLRCLYSSTHKRTKKTHGSMLGRVIHKPQECPLSTYWRYAIQLGSPRMWLIVKTQIWSFCGFLFWFCFWVFVLS